MIKIPILYIVFNRPDIVERSLEHICKIAPTRMFIAADGPRKDLAEDALKCAQVREIIQKKIDWPCEVEYLYREENLGCGKAVSEAITWFFSKVEKGIILEDDCFPDPTFFKFCEVLLNKYEKDKRVFHISGSNWQLGRSRGKADYYLSNFPAVWGWATWRDRWEKYSLEIITKQNLKKVKKWLNEQKVTKPEIDYHMNCFEQCMNGDIDTWDYQWRFLIFLNKAHSITPNRNVISNIGHREDGTHTLNQEHWRANLETNSIEFPLEHPQKLRVNLKADRYIIHRLLEEWYPGTRSISFLKKVNNLLKNL